LILQVADMPAYHALAHRLFAAEANVRNVRTFFSTHRSKFETRIAFT
jgi:Lrp/AsnC family leucine-responsive transcriptional regulator